MHSSSESVMKTWKVRFRSLMLLKSKSTGLVNHEKMLLLAKQIDAHRKENRNKNLKEDALEASSEAPSNS